MQVAVKSLLLIIVSYMALSQRVFNTVILNKLN